MVYRLPHNEEIPLPAMEQNHQPSAEYIYLGDRHTDPAYKGQPCAAVRRNGKCIRGRNGNMLVRFSDGRVVNVVARLLRKVKKQSGVRS